MTLELRLVLLDFCICFIGLQIASPICAQTTEKTIFDYSNNTKSYNILYQERGVIPISTLVTNPDNYCGSISYDYKSIPESLLPSYWSISNKVYNPSTHMGKYQRCTWDDLENDNGYLFSFRGERLSLEGILVECAKCHTKLTFGPGQNSGEYGHTYMKIPDDYVQNKEQYDSFLREYGFVFDNEGWLIKKEDGYRVKDSYPNRIFWGQIMDNKLPIFEKVFYNGEYTYSAHINYSSQTVLNGWSALLKNLSKWLDGYLIDNGKSFRNDAGKRVKRKDLIEILEIRFGFTGEGSIFPYKEIPKGVFPSKEDGYNFFFQYAEIFPDITLSVPMAVTYDCNYFWTKDDIVKLFNLENNLGKCALHYDMIGLDDCSMYLSENSWLPVLRTIGYEKRHIHGEPCQPSWSTDGQDFMHQTFAFHLSGGSLHNVQIHGNSEKYLYQLSQYITIQGAKLFISNCKYTKNRLNEFSIQNLGLSYVSSRFWEVRLYFMRKGRVIKEIPLEIDLKSISPNSQDYETYGGIVDEVEPCFVGNIRIPRRADSVRMGIVDKAGIYENYWMHNTDRDELGTYLLFEK